MVLIAAAAVLPLVAGCTRKAARRQPPARSVYVSLDRLVTRHPLWGSIRALDEQIAFLEGFRPRIPEAKLAARRPSRPPQTGPSPEAATRSLKRRIEARMAEVKALRMGVLERRRRYAEKVALEGAETETRKFAADEDSRIAAERLKLRSEMDDKIVNLRARAKTAQARLNLLTERVTRAGPLKEPSFEANRAAMQDHMTELATLRDDCKKKADDLERDWNAMLDALMAERGPKIAAYREARRDAAIARVREEHRLAVEALSGEITRTRDGLLASLAEVGKTTTLGPPAVNAPPLPAPPAFQSLADPAMEDVVALLTARRSHLRRAVWLNTRSIVEAASGPRRLAPVYQPASGLDDATTSFYDEVELGGAPKVAPPS